ncbi:MAG: ABC transporter permease, partial [Proteobacteria bacterium]|nr:ABC transporter permease [Pseudomonadota bacterium]
MILARMAWRNLWRNPRRTVITLFSMVFGLTMMIVGYALMDGMLAQMVRYATILGSGHVQIHHPDYLEDHLMYDTIRNPEKVLDTVMGTGTGRAAPRIFATALASSGNLSAGARLWGIDPLQETRVTELHKHLEAGAWLGERAKGEVILGRNLSRTLSAGPGDEIILLTQAADGSLGNDLFTVKGVLKSIGEALDRGGVIMHKDDLSALIVLPGEIHEIAVRLENPDRLVESRKAISRSLENPDLEVRDWKQLFPEIDQYLGLSSTSMTIMLFVIFSIASLGIINTQLMSLFERTREVGIMRALGLGPFSVASLVLLETFYLTLLASLAGGALGALWSLRLEKQGWDISWIGGGFDFIGVAVDPHLYARLTAPAVFHSIAVMFIVILAASL